MTTDEQLAMGWFKEGVETFLKDKHAATFNTPDYYYASGYLRAKQEARLSELTKDAEPVAVVNAAFTDGEFDKQKLVAVLVNTVKLGDLLYTHPPAPELKPLSLDEIHQRYKNLRGNEPPHYIDIYRDAEAALGILRGGL